MNNPTQPDSWPGTHKYLEMLLPEVGDTTLAHISKTIDKYHAEHEAQAVELAVSETVARNRKELAQDIKHRHWANDKLRDAYLDAVISVADEQLAELRNQQQ